MQGTVAAATLIALLAASAFGPRLWAEEAAATLLELPGSGVDPDGIDYGSLPVLSGDHSVVHPYREDWQFQLHNYLIHHEGRFWCCWSQGPVIEDRPGQEVWYATSEDGLNWSQAASLSGPPEEGRGYIARGLWLRKGELLALVASFKGKGAFGADKDLQLIAFAWDPSQKRWARHGLIYENAINNFPPQRLPSGEWILTRRDARFNVSVLVGGHEALDRWEDFPVVGVREVEGFRPDEPVFWLLPDRKTLFALYRDNGGSRRLFQGISSDMGRSWSPPVLSNFPNATSKLYSLELSSAVSEGQGLRLLISNANPSVNRRELHLSLSRDGQRFTRMARLDIPAPSKTPALETLWPKFRKGVASLQYPHAIQHGDSLWIAFSRNKWQTEILRVPLADIEALAE